MSGSVHSRASALVPAPRPGLPRAVGVERLLQLLDLLRMTRDIDDADHAAPGGDQPGPRIGGAVE